MQNVEELVGRALRDLASCSVSAVVCPLTSLREMVDPLAIIFIPLRGRNPLCRIET